MNLEWNYGDLFDLIGERVPARPAIHFGDETLNWRTVTSQSNSLARTMLFAGCEPGNKVAFYIRNHPAYLVGCIAAFKARLTHVNVNYRYQDKELLYLLDNSDARVLIYGEEFAEQVAAARAKLPHIKVFIEVGSGKPSNDFATSYERACEENDNGPLGILRSPDDQLFIYTGGTTGMPKGVMWRHQDRIAVYSGAAKMTPEEFVEEGLSAKPVVSLPACPFMHSTGFTSAINALQRGGSVVVLTAQGFSANEVLTAIQKRKVTSLVVVGDAVSRPLLNELKKSPGAYDLKSLKLVTSAGVMWSAPVKQGLLKHIPEATLHDTLGSSEGSNLGSRTTSKDDASITGNFKLGPGCRVLTEDFKDVEPGSGVPGLIAKSGPVPVGYYGDPERSAKTFPIIDGVRYSIPGDWCLLEKDGSVTLLGRGSGCINTGGEKVFAEEVEEAIKTHAAVEDALVIGIPDDRWGQKVVAVVNNSSAVSTDEIVKLVKTKLADYKAPKEIRLVSESLRFANGKADYGKAKEVFDLVG